MLRVTVPDFQKAGEWITYEAPETAEPYIREHIINQYPPVIQTRCKIETVANVPESVIEIIEPLKAQPKTPERIKIETRAEELGILGISLYTDEKLKERIAVKEARLSPPQQDLAPPSVKKKLGRPKKTVAKANQIK